MAVKNQGPEHVGADPLKSPVPAAADASVGHVGANAFEARVVQEVGTH